MPFGISVAPEEFQRRIDGNLEDDGVKAIADDILIWGDGETIEEATANHDERPLTLVERCKQKNIKLSKEKFQLRKIELFYMGVVLTDKGVKKKQDCVQSKPATTNKDEVRRLLGVVTYLSRFSEDLSTSQNRYEHCSKKKLRSSEKQMNRKLLKKLRPSSQTHHY